MAGSVKQFGDLWGSVKFDDRPENHVEREIGGQMKLIHSVAIQSSKDGSTVYVSFFEDSWPGFEHPAKGAPVFVHGSITKNGEYTNMNASAFAVLPFQVAKKKGTEAF